MAFVLVTPGASGRHIAAAPFERPLPRFRLSSNSRSLPAVLASVLVQGALLYLIFTHLTPAFDDPMEKPAASGRSLTLIDLAKADDPEEAAAPAETPVEPVAEPATPTIVAPAPLAEWKMVEMRSPAPAPATARTAAGAAGAGVGEGAGSAGSVGDDPYAGAAYRPRGDATASTPTPGRPMIVAPFLAPEINRLALEAALLTQAKQLGGSGFSLFIKADATGRAIDVKVLAATAGIDARAAQAIRATLLGRVLLIPGPAGRVRELVIGPIAIQPG